ncbi:MAG: hypothetical protein ACRDR6_20350 [Pseudonocardiaceae bacterium]
MTWLRNFSSPPAARAVTAAQRQLVVVAGQAGLAEFVRELAGEAREARNRIAELDA